MTTETSSQTTDLDDAAHRVDVAVERAELLEAPARRVALELKDAVEAFHRDALVRIVRRLKADPRGKELLFELVDDPTVYALLVMHGIVRADPATLAQRALDEVRPYLSSHGGGVELVGVEPPVVRVRLLGACTGCSQSATTLRELVETALVTRVAGIERVDVVPAEPEVTIAPDQIAVRTRWSRGPALDDVPDGRVTLWHPDGGPAVALVRIGERVAAYRDACAHQGLSLERAMLDAEGAVLTCPWHGYKYRALTGECLSAADTRLRAYPARVDGGRVWLRLED